MSAKYLAGISEEFIMKKKKKFLFYLIPVFAFGFLALLILNGFELISKLDKSSEEISKAQSVGTLISEGEISKKKILFRAIRKIEKALC